MGRPRKNRDTETPDTLEVDTTQIPEKAVSTIDTSLDDLGNIPSFNQPTIHLNQEQVKVLDQALNDSVEVVHPGKIEDTVSTFAPETTLPIKHPKPAAAKVAEREAEIARRKRWHRGERL